MNGIHTNQKKKKILSRYYSEQLPASYSYPSKLKQYTQFSRKDIKQALQGSDAYTLHKPIIKKFLRRKVIISGKGEEIQVDLIDTQHLGKYNKGVKYILTAIDVFSKYAWAFPIKNKKGEEIVKVLKKILSTPQGKKFRFMHTDRGTEFYNKYVKDMLKKNNIQHFSTFNDEMKASIVERFNRTLKIKLWKLFTKSGSLHFISSLPKLIESYNNTIHDTLRTEPTNVNRENMEKIWWRIYGLPDLRDRKSKYEIGDYVRITSYKKIFDKGYIPSWREEIFKIKNIIQTKPITYKVEDLNNEEIDGSFYSKELQHIDLPEEYKIEKIIKSRGTGRNKEVFVKWKGYSDNFNSWIKASDIKTL